MTNELTKKIATELAAQLVANAIPGLGINGALDITLQQEIEIDYATGAGPCSDLVDSVTFRRGGIDYQIIVTASDPDEPLNPQPSQS